ncbi:Ulp1-like peptidase [Cucumis melo var. makuwa]|uniref:Ulp1-like peptidase n=1 Tax=Cucumis melo var. makuwa TaxID=1194695 RepID=A0A5D3CYQ0_CUCMM|nr:Ulp1-like peptidase [Cucumis melo var. makuwa]
MDVFGRVDAMKVALALFIETVMVGTDKKPQFDMDIEENSTIERKIRDKEGMKFQSSRILQHQGLRACFSVWAYETPSTTVVLPKLMLSPQEKAFKESRIRGDDNMDIEEDELMPDRNSSDTNTPFDCMNNLSSGSR